MEAVRYSLTSARKTDAGDSFLVWNRRNGSELPALVDTAGERTHVRDLIGASSSTIIPDDHGPLKNEEQLDKSRSQFSLVTSGALRWTFCRKNSFCDNPGDHLLRLVYFTPMGSQEDGADY